MRFKLCLKPEKIAFGNRLPINYPYLLSSWIYMTIGRANETYAGWLHDNGFKDGNKIFKFFTFSNLYTPKLKLEGDRLCLLSDTVSFYLSFLPERSTEEFIKGLFKSQRFTLGDRHSKVQFEVQQIELMPPPDFSEMPVFKTISPVVVSTRGENGKPYYLSPKNPEYSACLLKNLKEKYQAYYNYEFLDSENFVFELLTEPNSRLITIKAGEPQESKIRGYKYSFRLQADKELMNLAYASGFGEKGSMGFGMIEVE